MEGKICPILSIQGEDYTNCKEAACQLWEANTGTCGLVTLSHLKGMEVSIRGSRGIVTLDSAEEDN